LLSAADFQNGQAARAVLGQDSFSSSAGGLTPVSIAVQKEKLYVAHGSRQVWAFDLSRLPDTKGDGSEWRSNGCAVCIEAPVSVANQSVTPGVARVSSWSNTVAAIDTVKRRVLLWRDAAAGGKQGEPDVIINHDNTAPGALLNPVSVAVDGKRLFVGDSVRHQVLVWNTLPTSDDQPPDVVLGAGETGAYYPGVALTRADQIGIPSSLASDGMNLFVGDTLRHRVLVFSPVDAPMLEGATVNSASLVHQSYAPGTLVTISGPNLSDAAKSSSGGEEDPLPTMLGGTEVLLDGVALPLLSVAKEQVQLQLPYELAGRSSGSLYVRTHRRNGDITVTAPIVVDFASSSPGLFAFPGSEPRVGMLLHESSGENGAGLPVTEESKAKAGETLTIWAAGLGLVPATDNDSPAKAGIPFSGPSSEAINPVTAEVNGQPAEVISARLPKSSVGVYEVRIAMPSIAIAKGEAQLRIFQNGIPSNTVMMPVQR
jgi:uncharacterized protein (TIGR03437 family)